MIPIEDDKKRIDWRIDWNAIRAEYIGGGISQRKLAEKHGIPVDILLKRANKEHWKSDRETASNKAAIKAQQKTVDAAADNATIAQDIKRRLLLRLARVEEKFPMDATQIEIMDKGRKVTFKLRDLTAAYRDLTDNMTISEDVGNELLQSLMALERGAKNL